MLHSKLKVLFLDIEASNLSASMGYILCIGYKWAHEAKPHIIRIDETKEGRKHVTDDIGVLKEFSKVYEEADIVVHHFGQYYDIPFIQTRRLMKGLKPMPVTAQVDTWRIAKKRLKFHSNRLDAILSALKCPYAKTQLKGDMWIEAMAGNRKALDYVVDHCRQDVLALEWVYNHIKAVWDQHPRTVLSKDDSKCPLCGGKGNSKGLRASAKHQYRRVVCVDCGHNWKGERI